MLYEVITYPQMAYLAGLLELEPGFGDLGRM